MRLRKENLNGFSRLVNSETASPELAFWQMIINTYFLEVLNRESMSDKVKTQKSNQTTNKEKLLKLKKEIQNNTYQPDLHKTTQKIIEHNSEWIKNNQNEKEIS